MTLERKLALTGISVATLGLIGLSPLAISWAYAQTTPAQSGGVSVTSLQDPKPAVEPTVIGKPVRLEVPAANINIGVVDGHYNTDNGEWSLTWDKAQFALPTSQPNDKSGNTLIYGHDSKPVFHRLHGIKPGAEAKLYTENGHVFTYTLRSSEVIDPTDVDIISYEGKPQLTLQTCSGILSENRRLFYFDLVNVQ